MVTSVWADLGPPRGRETSDRRPVVIVSHDALNRVVRRLGRGVVTIVPMTTKANRVYPLQVFLLAAETGLPADNRAHPEQVRAVEAERVAGRSIGALPPERLRRLDAACRWRKRSTYSTVAI